MNLTILRFDSIGSTNDEALSQARRGAAEGLCVAARQQTAGRGRHGRVWISPAGAGLYSSFVLRPKMEMRLLPLVTLMAGVAVHDALEEAFALVCDIKWSNDVRVDGKKISGILSETTETAHGLAVVVGIGINLNSTNFPAEIAETATSVEQETGMPADCENLLAVLTGKLARFYAVFGEPGGAAKIREEWARRSSFAFGKRVKASLAGETICGETRGIEEDGALRIKTAPGEIKTIRAGEVETVRPAD